MPKTASAIRNQEISALGADAFDTDAVLDALGGPARLRGEVSRVDRAADGTAIAYIGHANRSIVIAKLPAGVAGTPGTLLGRAVSAFGEFRQASPYYAVTVTQGADFRVLPVEPPLIPDAEAAANVDRGRRVTGTVSAVDTTPTVYRLRLGQSQGKSVYAEVAKAIWARTDLVGKRITIRGGLEDLAGVRILVQDPAQIAVEE